MPSFPNPLPFTSPDSVQALLQKAPHHLARLPHLSPCVLQPEIEALHACGAYVSAQCPEPWSDLVRRAKHPPSEAEERRRVLTLISGAFCELLTNQSSMMSEIDAVVAIPANPARRSLRGMSLPDELGCALQESFGLPFLPLALRSQAAPTLQMRGMAFEKRPLAIKGSMVVGESEEVVGRALLLVDDVVSSGSTLREAARLLLECGATRVYAACLASCLTGQAI